MRFSESASDPPAGDMIALFFDIDGTLLLANSGGPAMAVAAERVFGAALDRYDIPFSGRTDAAISRAYHEAHSAAWTAERRSAFRDAYLHALPHALQTGGGRRLPGVTALLDEVSGRPDVTLGLLTGNFAAGARAKLSHFNFSEYFDFSIGGYGDDSTDRNDVAAAAVAKLPDGVETTWVIGDTPADVTCGKSVGAKTLAVATGSHSLEELADCDADLLLPDLSDTQAVLRGLGLSG
ncbi:MAG: haloacid dehalogenase-like hydrolase [Planctomycetota bacterium]